MERMFHTPEGVRDLYNGECRQKQLLTAKISHCIHSYGYQDIETPSFEFFDVFSREVGTTPSKDLYKFFDREGNTLVLRPDFTPSVARAAASYFLPDKMPVRLCYKGNTFINNSSYQGRLKESTEMGVECMGDSSLDSDAEILAMAVKVLRTAGLVDFQISVGEVSFFEALVKEAALQTDQIAVLRDLVCKKNFFGVEEMILALSLDPALENAFKRLPQLFGDLEILKEARELTMLPEAIKALDRLEKIYEILKLYGVEDHIFFDLGLLSQYSYYTGIIFQGYSYGSGEAILKGGRYDRLLEHFQRPAPAIGFALTMEQIMNALSRQDIPQEEKAAGYLLIYREASRKEALSKAEELRRAGEIACSILLNDEAELPSLEAYAKAQSFASILVL